MILFENLSVVGWEPAIRGMRNPKNSWDRSDTTFDPLLIGPNDYDLMMGLVKGGPVHAKFRRMIVVYVDITAPLYWWKDFDTYKVGTVANSCSTMHKIHAKEFTLDDFSHEHLCKASLETLENLVLVLEYNRKMFVETRDKSYWWQMIQLLPTSYNQKRTVEMNYEMLANLYKHRKDHKLDEFRHLCIFIKQCLPYSEMITYEGKQVSETTD